MLSATVVLVLAALPPVGTPLLAPPALEPVIPPVGSPELVAPAPLSEPEPAAPASDRPVALESERPSGAVSSEVQSKQAEPDSEPRHPWFGAQVDAGIPDGFGGSLIFRPWYFVRAHLGGMSNTASGGIRGGLTLVPFRFYFTPALTGEIGHFFDGNLEGLVNKFADSSSLPSGSLEKVSYTFYSAHLGLEFGAPDRFIVYLRGGVSRIAANLKTQSSTSGNTTVDPGEIHVDVTIPSAKVGILLYF